MIISAMVTCQPFLFRFPNTRDINVGAW
jgi:hypothetical protein